MVTQDKARSDRSDSPSTSLPLESTTNANRRLPVAGDVTSEESSSLLKDSQDHEKGGDRSETGISPWGISIKGQAKRLGQLRERSPSEPSGSNRESRLVEVNSMESTVPRKRSLNPTSLEMLHAHLSPAQNKIGAIASGTTKDVTPEDPSKAMVERR